MRIRTVKVLKKQAGKRWNGFNGPSTVTSGELLITWLRTFAFQKMQRIP